MGKTNGINGYSGANGSSRPVVCGKTDPTSAPGAAPDADGRPLSELIPIEIGLFRRGYTAGIESGRTTPDVDTEATLRDFAGDSAQRLAAAPFRPEENISDSEAQREYQRVLAGLDQAKDQEDNARAKVGEFQSELAAHEPEPTPPGTPYLVGLLGVLGIAATLAFSLSDLVFSKLFTDRVQSIFAAWMCGALFAGLVTWTLLSGASHEGSEKRHWWGVGMGVVFGLGLLLLRWSTVRGDGERLMACGFAVIEVVAVIAVDLYAAGLRQGWATYRSRLPGYCEATHNLANACKRLEDRGAAVKALEGRARRFREDVRLRESLVRSTTTVRAAAERAIVAGYRLAIEHNRGRLRGVDQSPLSDDEIVDRLGRSRGAAFRTASDGDEHEADA